jgi:hypothetical protein
MPDFDILAGCYPETTPWKRAAGPEELVATTFSEICWSAKEALPLLRYQ